MSLQKRGRTWHIRRRVPTRYRSIDAREAVYLSLHTDSEMVARQKMPIIWQEQVNSWEARLAGDTEDAEQRHAAAQDLARLRGMRYLPAGRVAALPREELLQRVEMVQKPDGKPDSGLAVAVLGGAAEPPIRLSRALELYWGLARDRTLGKSPDQVRRWENPRKKAVRNAIAVMGDREIAEITRDNMLDFRDWWMDRMATQGLTPNSGNKDLGHLGDVLKTVNQMKRLNLALPLAGLSFKEGEQAQRVAFSRAWTKEHFTEEALASLNDEARGIILVMINTGARPSELAALRPEEIRLEHPVPHLAFAPLGRQLKTSNARRKIPLVGISLRAMREFPGGFPRYQDNSATLSSTANKYLRENGLCETEEHTLYGLRHGFEDRMLAAGIDERIRRDLMGHALKRERYGEGGGLEQVRALLEEIAL